jgi:hypothetical protein
MKKTTADTCCSTLAGGRVGESGKKEMMDESERDKRSFAFKIK